MTRVIALTILLVLAACAGEPLPPIQGQWIALNPHLWQPTPEERAAIGALPEHD